MWGHGVYQALHKVQPTGLSEGLRTVGDAVVYHVLHELQPTGFSRKLGTVGDAVVYPALHNLQPTDFLQDQGRVAISKECCPVLVTPQEAGACGRTRIQHACMHVGCPAES